MSFTFQSICVKVVNYTEGSITLDGSAEEVAETIYELSEMSIKDQREWLRSSWTEMEVDDGYSCDGEIIPDFLSSDLLREIKLELDDETKEEAIVKITQALNDWV